jgi:putative ABC transport system permease protein
MNLGLPPIFATLRRNKISAALIGLQIAVTLAIMCNALFIIQQRLAQVARPSGTDEADLFAIDNDWIRSGDHASQVSNDLAALRNMPGVVGAYITNAYPLTNSGWSSGLSIQPPDQNRPPAAQTAEYFADGQTLRTLGLRLVAGRNFSAADVVDRTRYSQPLPDGLIVTQTLARKLFPDAAAASAAVGRRVYFESKTRTTPIIGVVARLQTPWVSDAFGRGFVDNSVLVPYRYVDDEALYVVRAAPGATRRGDESDAAGSHGTRLRAGPGESAALFASAQRGVSQ